MSFLMFTSDFILIESYMTGLATLLDQSDDSVKAHSGVYINNLDWQPCSTGTSSHFIMMIFYSFDLYPPSYSIRMLMNQQKRFSVFVQFAWYFIHFIISLSVILLSVNLLYTHGNIFRVLNLKNYFFLPLFILSKPELETLLEGDQPSWAAKQMIKYLEKNVQCKKNNYYLMTLILVFMI